MAASNLNLGKASGGVLNIQPADGTTNTSIVLPASGTVTTNEYVNSSNLGNGSTTFNGFGGTGFKNYIINGNFDIWQRGTSQTSVVGYGSDDRWYNGYNGSTRTHSQVACTDTERALFNASYFSRTVVSSVAGATNFIYKAQPIENVTKLAGKTVTLSFWAKADSAKNIAVEILQNFGTGGSPSSGVTGVGISTINLTTTWQKKTITITIPNIVGKTLGTDGVNTSYTNVQFWFEAGSSWNSRTASLGQQSGTFDIAQVQLEEGSVATPFEQRPYGLELSLCQRYYQVFNEPELSFTFDANFTGANQIYNSYRACRKIPLMQTMRVAPTVTRNFVNSGFSAIDTIATTNVLHIGPAYGATTANGNCYIYTDLSLSAEL